MRTMQGVVRMPSDPSSALAEEWLSDCDSLGMRVPYSQHAAISLFERAAEILFRRLRTLVLFV